MYIYFRAYYWDEKLGSGDPACLLLYSITRESVGMCATMYIWDHETMHNSHTYPMRPNPALTKSAVLAMGTSHSSHVGYFLYLSHMNRVISRPLTV